MMSFNSIPKSAWASLGLTSSSNGANFVLVTAGFNFDFPVTTLDSTEILNVLNGIASGWIQGNTANSVTRWFR